MPTLRFLQATPEARPATTSIPATLPSSSALVPRQPTQMKMLTLFYLCVASLPMQTLFVSSWTRQ